MKSEDYGWIFVFFFKQKPAYDMRISDWSSDVCSSDLPKCSTTWRCLLGMSALAWPGFLPGGEKGIGPWNHNGSPTGNGFRASLRRGSTSREIGSTRSEERRVGKACVCMCILRWTPSH